MGPQIRDAQMVAFCCHLSKEMVYELWGLKKTLTPRKTSTHQYAFMACTEIILSLLLMGYIFMWGHNSSVGIATSYRLDGPGIESQWGEIFRTSPDRP
jgi:hypothetical protein